jgi:hypothetical protein
LDKNSKDTISVNVLSAFLSALKNRVLDKGKDSLSINDKLGQMFGTLQGADVKPTTQCAAETTDAISSFQKIWESWQITEADLRKFNVLLKQKGLDELKWEGE